MQNKQMKLLIDSFPDSVSWYEQIKLIDKTNFKIDELFNYNNDKSKDLNICREQKSLISQMETIYKLQDKNEWIKDLIDSESLKTTIKNIDEYLKEIFDENQRLSGKFVEFLKEGEFRTTIFNSMPRGMAKTIKDLRVPTISLLKEYDSIKLDINKLSFVYDKFYFTTNQVNEMAVIAKFVPDFTPSFMISLIENYKEKGSHYIETDEYKVFHKYIINSPCVIQVKEEEFFRGEKNNTGKNYDEARMRNLQYGYSKMGRYNFPGFNYLYVSDKKIGPKLEILKHECENDFSVQLARFENDTNIKIFDVDSKNLDFVLKKQLKEKLKNPNKTIPDEYIISAMLSECIKESKLAEGIKYSEKKYINYVFYNTKLFRYTDLGIFNINEIN